MVKRLRVGGNGGFVGGKEGTKGSDGCVMKMDGGWWAEGEGSAKVARKGIDEGCIAFMWREIGLVIFKKDLAKGGCKLEVHSKLGDR